LFTPERTLQPVPGEYAVDARLLLWNAKGRDYEAEQACKSYGKGGDVPRDFLEKLYPVHAGFKGFKFYVPAESCCEVRDVSSGFSCACGTFQRPSGFSPAGLQPPFSTLQVLDQSAGQDERTFLLEQWLRALLRQVVS
jgi:hypothetical protein